MSANNLQDPEIADRLEEALGLLEIQYDGSNLAPIM
jgi:hypothetical protein